MNIEWNTDAQARQTISRHTDGVRWHSYPAPPARGDGPDQEQVCVELVAAYTYNLAEVPALVEWAIEVRDYARRRLAEVQAGFAKTAEVKMGREPGMRDAADRLLHAVDEGRAADSVMP